MNKLIIALFFTAVGGVLWTVIPSNEGAESKTTSAGKTSKKKNVRNASMNDPDDDVLSTGFPSASIDILKGPGPEQPMDEQPTDLVDNGPQDDEHGSAPGYFNRVGGTAEASTVNRVPEGARRRPWPKATEGEFAVEDRAEDNRPPKPNALPENDPFPQVHVALFKDSVSRYFQRFDSGEAMPAEAPIGQVVPVGLVTELGVSPETQLTMLGPFHLDDVRAYQNVSTVSEQHHGLLGLSYVTPDGEAHRKYVRIQANIVDE